MEITNTHLEHRMKKSNFDWYNFKAFSIELQPYHIMDYTESIVPLLIGSAANIALHIEAETKSQQFRRPHFQMHFIECKC